MEQNKFVSNNYSINFISSKEIEITYFGMLYENNSISCKIVYGFGDNWTNTTNKEMIKTELGFSTSIILEEFNVLNFCFCNEKNEWDNNDSNDYKFEYSIEKHEEIEEQKEETINLEEEKYVTLEQFFEGTETFEYVEDVKNEEKNKLKTIEEENLLEEIIKQLQELKSVENFEEKEIEETKPIEKLSIENIFFDSNDKKEETQNDIRFDNILETDIKDIKVDNKADKEEKIEKELIDNGILLISEIQDKVILPYTKEEVENILKNENYENAEKVIEDKFTRKFSDYKNLYRSRINETYKLLTKKEKYSKLQATPMAIELFKNKYVHPAIIAACKSLEELDVYLDCLNKNELDDFKVFEIKYELYPVEVKENNILTKANNMINAVVNILKKTFGQDKTLKEKTINL